MDTGRMPMACARAKVSRVRQKSSTSDVSLVDSIRPPCRTKLVMLSAASCDMLEALGSTMAL
ncbi:MAG: hypothetical protein BWY85_01953 [Firmicutes bacterium ADurb.Bin506]|nr:MAG: hypothetical protein BWY85_01953 [Firmicutes bacterium ADurb.Bin506]